MKESERIGEAAVAAANADETRSWPGRFASARRESWVESYMHLPRRRQRWVMEPMSVAWVVAPLP